MERYKFEMKMQSYWLRDHPKLMRLGTQHNDDDFFILEFY